MNKPADTITTRRDPEGRPTVYDFLPSGLPRVEAVGRLDRPTTGLLLFTNDHKLGQALLEPENEIPRVYQVVTNLSLPDAAFLQLRQGIFLTNNDFCGPIKIEKLDYPTPGKSYLFTLHEGKNREIRRLVMHFGGKVRGLHRLSFGSVVLGNLKPGMVRPLSQGEVAKLRASVRSRQTGKRPNRWA